jgi:hypothetical protein
MSVDEAQGLALGQAVEKGENLFVDCRFHLQSRFCIFYRVLNSNIIAQGEDTERSTQEAAAEVEAAASQPPPAAPNDVNINTPEAQFHLLDKAVLLEHLRELKAEKTVNGKAIFKSYIKWEELNPTQRNKTISF